MTLGLYPIKNYTLNTTKPRISFTQLEHVQQSVMHFQLKYFNFIEVKNIELQYTIFTSYKSV